MLLCCNLCRTIPSVVRAWGGQAAVNSICTALAPLMHQQQQHCTVSVLLVMYGLPRLLIGSIVAHELMHAYLRMRNVAGLPLQVRAGVAICADSACVCVCLHKVASTRTLCSRHVDSVAYIE